MLSGFISALSGNVVMGWVWRRVLEVGGGLGILFSIFSGLPPEYQGVIIAILTGQGGTLTIGAAIGFAVYVWSQIMSYRATVRPQIVTPDKKRRVLTEAEARAETGWDGPIETRSK